MTQSIVISKKVETAVQPKPTKKELIEAMAQIQFKKLTEERAHEVKRREDFRNKFNEALKNHYTARLASAAFKVYNWGSNIDLRSELSIQSKDLPPSLSKQFKEMDSWGRLEQPDIKNIRREIAARLNNLTPTDDRVKTLVETPEVVAGLKKGLKQLGF